MNTRIYTFIVRVAVDTDDIDRPTAQAVANELQSNLEWDAPRSGIIRVEVLTVGRDYREQVIGSHEQ